MENEHKKRLAEANEEAARRAEIAKGVAESGPWGLPRRDFLKRAVLGSVSLATAAPWMQEVLAGDGQVRLAPQHFIPVEKHLPPEWIRVLFEKGEPEWFSGKQLDVVGMPVGGVCAGQVYLLGDGRLGCWDIFNQNFNTGYGAVNWKEGRGPEWKVRGGKLIYERPVRQGFAIEARAGGRIVRRTLDREGFPNVRFRGEYPIGRVEYPDPALPVRVSLEAFSPFIPLDAKNSSFPAVLLGYTVSNPGETEAEIALVGWLSNSVCYYSASSYGKLLEKTSRLVSRDGWAGATLSARWKAGAAAPRPPEVFADFEGKDYGDWRAEGKAFGKGPARGTLPNQQPVSGFQGKGLVNSFLGGDAPTGRLVSPQFVIRRPYISFLIGGGADSDKTCMKLVVDGKTVRSASGANRERLRPQNWDVSEFLGKRAHLEIVDQASGPWGHINVDRIEFRDTPAGVSEETLPREADFGEMGLYALGGGRIETFDRLPGEATALEELFAPKPAGLGPKGSGATVRLRARLRPGETRTFWFAVAWHMPNMYRGGRWVGNHYARLFQGCEATAGRLADRLEDLTRQTRLWRDTYYDSTLPWWLLDRIHAPAANLATTTCQWWHNGRFWAWEGCGCCAGTCGHVWNYAQAMARLFPELERSVREMQDFAEGVGLHEDGSIGFRGEGWTLWAGDAQGGYILKAYREHLCSPESGFLNRNWPRIRKAMEFLIRQDRDNNGLIEGAQHQTYDENYYGPNTFVGALYLGALRAAEEMARAVGEVEFARRCRKLFEVGSKLSVKRLFNGEYFIQEVDLKKHPDWQYGEGCLADQMFGQNWAHQTGLGYLYPPETVRKALKSVWKYCWAPDVTRYNEAHPPERWFVSKGDAGLFTCTWPKARYRGRKETRYRNEVWTGIEYQVASHMAREGMLTEALAICRAVHERYRPPRFNPWNEVECGDHYARAMASWGMLLGLSGFEYDGPAGRLGFAPRLTPENFRCAFTGAEGWGAIAQTRRGSEQVNSVAVRWGKLRLQSLRFELPKGKKVSFVEVTCGDRKIPAAFQTDGAQCLIKLAAETTVHAGQTLSARLAWS